MSLTTQRGGALDRGSQSYMLNLRMYTLIELVMGCYKNGGWGKSGFTSTQVVAMLKGGRAKRF